MTSTWREIPGTGYAVSDDGKVASKRWGTERQLKPGKITSGYLQVALRIEGKRRAILVHRLVAELFISRRPSAKHQVNHKNGIRTDNRVDNLEWLTCGDNMRHAYRVLRRPKCGIAIAPRRVQ